MCNSVFIFGVISDKALTLRLTFLIISFDRCSVKLSGESFFIPSIFFKFHLPNSFYLIIIIVIRITTIYVVIVFIIIVVLLLLNYLQLFVSNESVKQYLYAFIQ